MPLLVLLPNLTKTKPLLWSCAKSPQSCPTLHDSMDCSLPGFLVHGDPPGKNTGMDCHALLQGIFANQVFNISQHWQVGSLPLAPPWKFTDEMNLEIEFAVLDVQLLHSVQIFATPRTAACHFPLSFTISQSLLRFMSIESVMPSNHLILSHPLLLLPSIFPSVRVFSNELALCMRWPEYQNCSISPSSEYSGLIFFNIDWLDHFEVQGTLESSLAPQFESINSLVLSFLYGLTLTSHICT